MQKLAFSLKVINIDFIKSRLCGFLVKPQNQSENRIETKMPFSFQVTGAEKDQLVVSLAALLLHDTGVEISADNLNAVVNASGNSVAAYFPTLFATYIEKAGGVEKFLVGPSAGGVAAAGTILPFLFLIVFRLISYSSSAPAGNAAAAPAAEQKKEEKKEEVVDALEGGMDLFGGGGGGGGDY